MKMYLNGNSELPVTVAHFAIDYLSAHFGVNITLDPKSEDVNQSVQNLAALRGQPITQIEVFYDNADENAVAIYSITDREYRLTSLVDSCSDEGGRQINTMITPAEDLETEAE